MIGPIISIVMMASFFDEVDSIEIEHSPTTVENCPTNDAHEQKGLFSTKFTLCQIMGIAMIHMTTAGKATQHVNF